jgi:hypothetical protein
MTDKEAMAMALDALIEAQTNDDSMEKWDRNKKAITALKERLANHAMREVQRLGQEIEQEADELTIAYMSGLYDGKKAQRTEQNFCPRCGKRTKDIHTCTPPQENA